jgi:FixJ family two-component response regulator
MLARRRSKHHDAEKPGKLARVKSLPWAAILQGTVVVGRHWRALSEKDRARLTQLVRDSQGRLSNLSSKERAELRKLARKLDMKGIGRDLFLLSRSRQLKRKRRHRRASA